VQHLNLSWNGLENIGCLPIATALAENHGLRTLDLSCTRMGASACTTLAHALLQNTTINTLLVSGNQIGVKGNQALAQALSENRSLQHLGIEVRCCSYFWQSIFDAVWSSKAFPEFKSSISTQLLELFVSSSAKTCAQVSH
jgi:hypothetical protein